MDQTDLLILTLMNNREESGELTATISEIQKEIGEIGLIAIYNRIVSMEEAGFIQPPPVKNSPRSRRLTQKGKELLQYENKSQQRGGNLYAGLWNKPG